MDYKDICVADRQLPIHQLNKLNEKGTKREDFFPISVVQAIFDKTGIRLDAIISSFNYLFLPWQGTKEATRLQVVCLMRRKSLVVCYRDLDDEITIEMYNSNERGDNEWKKDENWKDFVDFILDAVKDIFENINDYEELKNVINAAVESWLEVNVTDKVEELIQEAIEKVDIDSIITSVVNAWIANNQDTINQLIKDYVNNNLDTNLEPLVGEFFTACINYMRQNERVIANSLARHEQAITNLQNNVNTD